MNDVVSVIIVNYNGRLYLEKCFDSLLKIDKENLSIEIIMVDNLSTDGSVNFVKERFPEIKIIENDLNNFSRALNLGIKNSQGHYIAILNNDTTVERQWLKGLLYVINQNENIGAVQSKILFSEGEKINSVGVKEVEDFYFRDIGFGEKNNEQYEEIKELDYFSGGSILLKRECIESVGEFDEDFIMYCEDVDYSIRCKALGWKMFYAPESVIYHRYRGTASSELCEYFCSRNRLICLAKHYPLRFPKSIKTSHFYLNNKHENLYQALIQSVKKLIEHNNNETSIKALGKLKDVIVDIFGYEKAYNFFSHLEVMLGLRKIRIGIYDHALHFAGGGQRYAAEMAEMLQDKYDITYIANKDINLTEYKDWFDIDLSRCRLKVIKIPFYEKLDRYFIDEGMVITKKKNPFDIIKKESLKYDVFINANMLGKVKPLSVLSVFICHFPDRPKQRFFHVDEYDYLISNSSYTTLWLKRRWGLDPTHNIYPPVDMYNSNGSPDKKKKIIISVARFEEGGSKKQLKMVKAFADLSRTNPDIKNKWRFILAGGSSPGNPYFSMVKREVESAQCNIELRPNMSYSELKELYMDATIFWHACGLNEKNPHLIEHFGMTTVEAMQNYCVPIVFDGGGQMEIVKHGISGFRFKTIKDLELYTLKVINDTRLREEIAIKAYQRSHKFNLEVFKKNVFEFFAGIENELKGVDALND